MQQNHNKQVITLSPSEQIPDILRIIISSWSLIYALKKGIEDISTIAKELNQTEANISMKIKKLEKLGIVKCYFKPAKHGVRKLCKLDSLEIKIKI